MSTTSAWSRRGTPLLPASVTARDALRRPIYAQGGERQIAVLFADIRDFTHITETKLPYDVVFLLNRYCRAMGAAIETAGGRVDKFTGDGVMALFGLETDGPEACRQALTAARRMSAQLVAFNQALAPDLHAPLAMGVGIHFGPAIVGDMGDGRWRSLTAVGDTVNTASRLEALCKVYHCELVVSDDLLACAGAELQHARPQEAEIWVAPRRSPSTPSEARASCRSAASRPSERGSALPETSAPMPARRVPAPHSRRQLFAGAGQTERVSANEG